MREHTELQDMQGRRIGEVTSGLLGPTIDKPVAMGYVDVRACRARHTRLNAIVRGKPVPMEVAAMPFVAEPLLPRLKIGISTPFKENTT